MKKFSCEHFFSGIGRDRNSEKLLKKFYVAQDSKPVGCDYEKRDTEIDFSPEKHLMNVHGFLADAPGNLKRGLEIELCKIIEKYLIEQ